MRPVNVLVGQVIGRLAVDPGPDVRPLCHDAVAVPLAVPEVRVRHAARLRRQPAASRRLAVEVAGKARARLDLDLRPEHPPGTVVRALARAPLLGPRADLHARVQRVVDPELELEVAVGLLGRQERVRAALARAPDDRAVRHPILPVPFRCTQPSRVLRWNSATQAPAARPPLRMSMIANNLPQPRAIRYVARLTKALALISAKTAPPRRISCIVGVLATGNSSQRVSNPPAAPDSLNFGYNQL
jgi:hypothetical protein